MPIFSVKYVKIYTGQKNLHEYIRGVRDKYEVCGHIVVPKLAKLLMTVGMFFGKPGSR